MSRKELVRPASALSYFLLLSCLSAQLPDKPVPEVKPAASDWTLADFRHSYLNQRILILKGTDAGRGSLGGWQPVKQAADGSFTNDYGKGAFINFKYKDQTPTIIDIRENSVGGLGEAQGRAKECDGQDSKR